MARIIDHAIQVHSSLYPEHKGYPLIEPHSEEGKIRSYAKALDKLNAAPEDNGWVVAVGWIPLHSIYKFSYDHQKQRGSWSYVYCEQNGVRV